MRDLLKISNTVLFICLDFNEAIVLRDMRSNINCIMITCDELKIIAKVDFYLDILFSLVIYHTMLLLDRRRRCQLRVNLKYLANEIACLDRKSVV